MLISDQLPFLSSPQILKTLLLENSILAKTKTYIKDLDSYGTMELISRAYEELSKNEDALWKPSIELADSTSELLFDHFETASIIVDSDGLISFAEVGG